MINQITEAKKIIKANAQAQANKSIKKDSQKNILLNNAEAVILDIIEGASYRDLANKYEVHQETICWFLHESEHSARAKNAFLLSSYNMIQHSYNQLISIKDDDTNAAVRRKTELAQHFRYLAMVKNPKVFNLNYKDPASIELANIIPQLVLKTVEPTKKVKNDKKKS
jgi:predicted DNA-binding protein (UPF0251 family)